jgi:hypothetical protein
VNAAVNARGYRARMVAGFGRGRRSRRYCRRHPPVAFFPEKPGILSLTTNAEGWE